MAIPKRGGGIPLRGSGGSGGGAIAVSNSTGGEETLLSSAITEIVWATQDVLAFGATLDPENPNRIIIGNPPVFEPKIVFSPTPTTQARVSVSDTNEPDTFSDGGWANSVRPATIDATPSFGSSLGRGFGAGARLRIIVKHDEGVVDEQTFTCAANGSQTISGITVTISNYQEDGDGSAYKGRINVTVDILSYLPYAQSGKFTVSFQFTEHKWGEVVTFDQTFFYDLNLTTPVISGTSSVVEHATPSERVIRYLSGIGCYDLGSNFTLNVTNINKLNDDTSHPSENILVGSTGYGINNYKSSPWVDNASWLNVSDLDTATNIQYYEHRPVDMTQYRSVGLTWVTNRVQDSWGISSYTNSNFAKVVVDTFVDDSTDLVETFNGEGKRLEGDYTTSWNSEQHRVSGEAIVFAGRLQHGKDIPTVVNNTIGVALTGLETTIPNNDVTGASRNQPNYSGHTGNAVFFRKFLTGNGVSYSSMKFDIESSGGIANDILSGAVKIYVWKLGSTDTGSPNLTLPNAYNPAFPTLSTSNSIWVHQPFDFGNFNDGFTQSTATSGARTNITGNVITMSFGNSSVITGVLVRIEVEEGTTIGKITAIF